IVTREELRERLWPNNTFVDYELALRKAVNRLREVLGDPAENPRFIETLPRRGDRFIGPITGNRTDAALPDGEENHSPSEPEPAGRRRALHVVALVGAVILLGAGGLRIYKRREIPAAPPQRTLTRVTFDPGLQIGATWSPDGRFLAFASNRG